MAIIQISRIQHRTGANVDLPQLSEGELGFATDERRLYIGNDPTLHPPADGGTTTQTEVLTEVSLLNFAKVDGAANSTFNVSGDLQNGQVLVAKDYAWVNAGGDANIDINLGESDYLKILGGTNGYVLQTDGTGNLTWTNAGVVTYNIADISKTNPAVVTTVEPNQLSTGVPVTIVDVDGMTQLRTAGELGTNKFYAQPLTSNTFALFTSIDFNDPAKQVNATAFTTHVPGSGLATAAFFTAGTGASAGANNQIQITDGSGVFVATGNLTFNRITNLLTVAGNITATKNVAANTFKGSFVGAIGATTPNSGAFTSITSSTTASVTGNLTANNIITGNIATIGGNLTAANLITTGIASAKDLTLTGNVNSSLIPNSDLVHDLGSPTQRWKELYLSGSSIFLGEQKITANATSVTLGNVVLSNTAFNAGNSVTANYLAGELTTAAQPNITSVGSLTALSVTGVANLGSVANVKILGGTTNYVLTTAGDGTLSWQPPQMGIAVASGSNTQVQFNDDGTTGASVNLTFNKSTGVLTSTFAGSGASLTNLPGANVSGAVAFATTANAVAGSNVTGSVAFANVANRVAGANVTGFVANAVRAVIAGSAESVIATNITGQVSNALVAGTVYTNAQPNITSVGTLTSLTTIGNVAFSGSNVSLGSVSNVRILGGTAGFVLKTDGVGNLSWVAQSAGSGGGTSTPGGDDTQIQYNSAGSFAGSTGLTYNNSTNTLTVDNIVASGAGLTSLPGANVTGEVAFAAVANSVAGANVTGAVVLATYATTANAVAGGNVSGAVTYAVTANAVAGANVSGEVSFAATANAVAGANVSGAVAFATTANSVAGANVSGAVAFATTANAVAGANVTGEVSFAATANSVAGSNVSGAVGLATYATTANAVAGANVSGAVAFATTANSVAGANVSGQVGNALVAGTVYTAAQPNITSVGTLTSLSVTGTATAGNLSTVGTLAAGDTTISGNLTVSGTTVTANVATMVVKDPIIEQGGNTTGALTTNDGYDRGQLLHYYDVSVLPDGAPKDAFMGWDNSNAEFAFGSDVTVTNEVAVFNTLGNVRAGTFLGNLTGNIVAPSTANLGAVANVTITGGTPGYMLSTDGAGVLSWQNPKSAPGTNTQVQFNDDGVSNTSSALTFDKTTGRLTATAFYGSAAGLTSIPGANVTGTVSSATSATTAGTVTTAAQPNITSVGNLTILRVDGNLTSNGNLIVTQLANLGNLANITITGGIAGYVIKTDGSGVLSWVAQPDVQPGGADTQVQFKDGTSFGGDSKLTFSKTTGILTANVFSGNGAQLTNLNASNIVGTVATATSATTATTATSATTAGTVTTAAQPNITSVGILNGAFVQKDGQYINGIDATGGIWDPDILKVTGWHEARHGMYFSSDSSGFTILSDPNQNGTGIYVFDASDKFGVVNNGYLTTTIDSVGSILPSMVDPLAQNLGGIAGSVGAFSSVSGTPNVAISFAESAESYIVPQSSTSGSGTGALFQVYTIPGSTGGLLYQVRVAALGSGYVTGDTVTILGDALGGATPANDLTLIIVSTADAYWKNLYVSDINITNRGNTSTATGWTVVGGKDGLYVINDTSGLKYLISMTAYTGGNAQVAPDRLGV